ncbi:unnamed protein product [Durusdinium trenchii]|uniref:Uncharacterized protein n=1 Tax=Durusdinium trenchii TaxID=1381693 RepID=A0ABP0SGU3_9DINO
MGTPNLHGSHPFVTAGSCLQVTNRLKAARSSLPRQPLWTAALARIRPAGTKMAGQKSLRQAEANSEENMSWPHGTPTSAWTDARGRHGPWTEGAQQQQRCTKHIDSLEKEAGVSSRRPRTWRQRRGGTT